MLRGLLRPLEQCESFSALQCAFVVGKNYRLQDIQLSKIPPRRPVAASARHARDSHRVACHFHRAGPAEASHQRRLKAGRNLVENTGLEPVTSWLQTRRSPS